MSRLAAGAIGTGIGGDAGWRGAALVGRAQGVRWGCSRRRVAVIDTTQNRVVATSRTQGPPRPRRHARRPQAMSAATAPSTVSVIDTASDKVSQHRGGREPARAAMAQRGRRLLVSGFGTNRSLVITRNTDRVVGEVAVPGSQRDPVCRRQPSLRASQKQGEAAIVILDLKTMTRAGAVPLDKTPRRARPVRRTATAHFTLAASTRCRCWTRPRPGVAQIPVGASPHEAAIHGRRGLGAGRQPGPGESHPDVSSGRSPHGDRGKLPHWVTSTSDATGLRRQEGSMTSRGGSRQADVIATIPVGNAPRKIAVQPAGAPRAAVPAAPRRGRGRKQKTVTIGRGQLRRPRHARRQLTDGCEDGSR